MPVEREHVLEGCEQRPPGRGAVAASRGRPVVSVGRGNRGLGQAFVARRVWESQATAERADQSLTVLLGCLGPTFGSIRARTNLGDF